MSLEAGTRLGPYEIVGPLGAGGMGEVYRARDTRLHRDVAVKILPAHLSADAERLRRFEDEARSAGAINHPNVLAVFDVGSAEAPYLVSELLEGKTLRDLLRAGPLPPRKTVDYAIQIARGLAAAHEKGITHRDLKPENIFITRDGRAKILDFGLARLTQPDFSGAADSTTLARRTEPGVVLGTPAYMSPEQVRGEPLGPPSDIFSFGAVLYEMVTGRAAFDRGAAGETTAAILRDDPPADSARAAPPALERMLRRCLEKSPGERFQSARDLALSLEAVSGTHERAPGGVARFSRRAAWIAAALAIMLVAAGVFMWRQGRALTGGGPPAIAVLPLQNLSRDAAHEYFADGMTEALITDLAKIGGLRVISRTSVMRYKGTSKSIPEIARELNVAAVLEGSVQESGGRVRITAQLIDARTDDHLWAESYDRELKDVLALQSDVARAAARAIRVTLTPADEAGLAARRSIDPDAYRQYLQARHALNRRTDEDIQHAVALLHQVIAKEPSYALAHAALSEGYSLFDDLGTLSPAEAYPKAVASARQALQIDPDLAEAHASLGHILMHQREWEAAKRELRRAIELNRSLAVAHRWYSNTLAWTGDIEAALDEARQAYKLDPVSPLGHSTVGGRLLEARRYDEAVEQFQKQLQAEPHSSSYFMIAWARALQNRHEEALAGATRFAELAPGREANILLAYVHAKAGRRGEAHARLRELESSAPQGREPRPVNMAHLYVALGEKDKALSTLETALRSDPGALVGIQLSPDMDAIAGEPRFQRMLQTLRVPSVRK